MQAEIHSSPREDELVGGDRRGREGGAGGPQYCILDITYAYILLVLLPACMFLKAVCDIRTVEML